MLIILPILVTIVTYLMILSELSVRRSTGDALREALIYCIGIISLFTVIFLEGLSIFSLITRMALVIVWATTLTLLIFIAWRKQMFVKAIKTLSSGWKNIKFGRFEIFLLVVISLYALLLFIIAVISPPNNVDSVQYHLARVVHWMENRNFMYFPVAYPSQLFYPIGAEALLLNNFVLVGSDTLVNLQQWFFMVFSLIVVTQIAKDLGADRLGQWFAAVCLVSLPIGILESTSTQNDYVTTFWVLSLAFLVLRQNLTTATRMDIFSIGVAAAMATVTKVGAYPFVAVLLLWLIVKLFRMSSLIRVLMQLAVVGIMMIMVNLPGWLRSYEAFSNPLGEQNYVGIHTFKIQTIGDLIISPIQHLALNLGTPVNAINKKIESGIIDLCNNLGGSNCSVALPGEWGFRMIGLSNHEDSAGNLLMLIVFFISIILYITYRKKVNNGVQAGTYLVVCILSILLFSWLVSVTTFMGRLQLPFFAMITPFVGLIFERLRPSIIRVVMVGILFCGLPWLLFNRTRPLIGIVPKVTLVRSVFIESRDTLLFANYPAMEDQVRHVTAEALKSGCMDISLRIDSRDPEYYFMSYLQPWKTGVWVESVSPDPKLERYKTHNFKACALICSICGYNPEQSGLIFAYKDKAMTLYLSPDIYVQYKDR